MITAQLATPSDTLCPLITLIGILFLVGKKMVQEKPALHRAGLCVAAIFFVATWLLQLVDPRATVGRDHIFSRHTDTDDFGGLVKPPAHSWDGNAVPWRADAPGAVMAAFTALGVGGVALGAAWIVLSMLAFMWSVTFGALLQKSQDACRTLHAKGQEWRSARAQEAERRRAQREYERMAPQRERERREAEEKERQTAEAQRRRQQARVGCELLYELYGADVGTRFPREAFEGFLEKHLSDAHAPEYVEEQGRKLQEVILKHGEKCGSAGKDDIMAVTEEHERRRKKIEASDIDGEVKKTILLLLNEQFFDRIQRFAEVP